MTKKRGRIRRSPRYLSAHGVEPEDDGSRASRLCVIFSTGWYDAEFAEDARGRGEGKRRFARRRPIPDPAKRQALFSATSGVLNGLRVESLLPWTNRIARRQLARRD